MGFVGNKKNIEYHQASALSSDWFPAGIDKLTEKSQVSEDGTMVSVPKTDVPHTVHTDQSAVAGTSDTESNSGRDNEVSVCVCACVCLKASAC